MPTKEHSNTHKTKRKSGGFSRFLKESTLAILGISLLIGALLVIWITTIKLPDFSDFENRKISNSTKIYDRTGEVVLYDVHADIKRTELRTEDISSYIRQATIAIEDRNFYNHIGISPRAIARMIFVALRDGYASQGGSTITQQTIKMTLLTPEKDIVRKLKEWILAIKLDMQLDKESILTIYLNESPYGGNIYGVEEASLTYFGKHAKDLTIQESAYLAAIPQRPTYFSPYGTHLDELENRKNIVLQKMYEQGMITTEEYEEARDNRIAFQPRENSYGKAWHFVFYVRDYLEKKYGKDEMENGGLKVITTLDWDLQKQAEEIIKEGALYNERVFMAKNAALVAIDPSTGQILSMVGSRDYFDTEIDGNYNVATAPRQPGSSFKPIVYSLAFMRGFTPETVLFDLPTEFSTNCSPNGYPLDGSGDTKKCYMPVNYDGTYRGPIPLRNALQLSLNIPAVKLMYLVGLKNTLDYAKRLGISTLNDASRFGLSLALGAGEVSLLEMTNVYATFANDGVYNKPAAILEISDKNGNVLEKYTKNQTDAVPAQAARTLSNVLSDVEARLGTNTVFNFGDRPVAVKTGTTNDYLDVWTIGYTPSIAVGIWAGNNNNVPIDKSVAGQVVAPIWRKFMDAVLVDKPIEYFPAPEPTPEDTLPVFKGIYCTPGDVSTILRYVGAGGSAGGAGDPQYYLWNTPIQSWSYVNGCNYSGFGSTTEMPPENGEGGESTEDPNTPPTNTEDPFWGNYFPGGSPTIGLPVEIPPTIIQ